MLAVFRMHMEISQFVPATDSQSDKGLGVQDLRDTARIVKALFQGLVYNSKRRWQNDI